MRMQAMRDAVVETSAGLYSLPLRLDHDIRLKLDVVSREK